MGFMTNPNGHRKNFFFLNDKKVIYLNRIQYPKKFKNFEMAKK